MTELLPLAELPAPDRLDAALRAAAVVAVASTAVCAAALAVCRLRRRAPALRSTVAATAVVMVLPMPVLVPLAWACPAVMEALLPAAPASAGRPTPVRATGDRVSLADAQPDAPRRAIADGSAGSVPVRTPPVSQPSPNLTPPPPARTPPAPRTKTTARPPVAGSGPTGMPASAQSPARPAAKTAPAQAPLPPPPSDAVVAARTAKTAREPSPATSPTPAAPAPSESASAARPAPAESPRPVAPPSPMLPGPEPETAGPPQSAVVAVAASRSEDSPHNGQSAPRMAGPTRHAAPDAPVGFRTPAPSVDGGVAVHPAPEVEADDWSAAAALRPVGLTILLVWAVGAVVRCVRLARSMRGLRELLRSARPVADDELPASLRGELRARSGAEVPAVLVSADVPGPMAVGLLRPVVVLPADGLATWTAGELRAVMLHEVAHCVRRDPLVGFLHRLAAGLLWPQPLLGLLEQEAGRAREETCDNHVLAADPQGRFAYARLLVRLADDPTADGSGAGRAAPAWADGGMAPGLGSGPWGLADRVAGLLDPRRSVMTRSARWSMAVTAAAMMVVAGGAASVVPGPASVAASAPAGSRSPAEGDARAPLEAEKAAEKRAAEKAAKDRDAKRAAAKPVPADETPAQLEHRIRTALAARMPEFKVDSTPLAQAVEFLADRAGVTVSLQVEALHEIGVEADRPVTLTLRNVTVQTALREVLARVSRGLDGRLDFVVRDGSIIVSTEAALSGTHDSVVYNVSDLVGTPKDEGHSEDLDNLKQIIRGTSPEGFVPENAADPFAGDRSLARIQSHRGRMVIRHHAMGHELIRRVLFELRESTK